MKPDNLLIFSLVSILVLSGIYCKKDETTGPQATDLDGTWTANADVSGTKMEFDATDSVPELKQDIVLLGGSITITVLNARYTLISVEPGKAPTTDSGAFAAANNTITLTSDDPEEDVLVFLYTRNGDFITLNTTGVDFPNTSIPAKLTIVLKKIGT